MDENQYEGPERREHPEWPQWHQDTIDHLSKIDEFLDRLSRKLLIGGTVLVLAMTLIGIWSVVLQFKQGDEANRGQTLARQNRKIIRQVAAAVVKAQKAVDATNRSRFDNIVDQCEHDNGANKKLVIFLLALPPQPGQIRPPRAVYLAQIHGFANAIVTPHLDNHGHSTCRAYARKRIVVPSTVPPIVP